MGVGAGIFGALAGLANTGEQLAGANQTIADKKATADAAALAAKTRQDAVDQRRAAAAATQAARLAKKPLGNPFVNDKGVTVQRFYNPATSELTVEPITGGNATPMPKPAKPSPEDQKLALWKSLGFTDDQIHRMAGVEGGLYARPKSGKAGGGTLNAADQKRADFWSTQISQGKAKYSDVPKELKGAVADAMLAGGLSAGNKLTPSEQQSQDSAKQLGPMIDSALTTLEPHKDETGGWSAFKQKVAKGVYGSGISPGKDEENILQSISFLQLLGVQPWTKTGRGKYIFEQIEPHLPKAGDSLGLTYQKLQTLRSLLPFIMAQPTDDAPGGGSIDDQILKALSQQQPTQ